MVKNKVRTGRTVAVTRLESGELIKTVEDDGEIGHDEIDEGDQYD